MTSKKTKHSGYAPRPKVLPSMSVLARLHLHLQREWHELLGWLVPTVQL